MSLSQYWTAPPTQSEHFTGNDLVDAHLLPPLLEVPLVHLLFCCLRAVEIIRRRLFSSIPAHENLRTRRIFTEGFAEECPIDSPRLYEWLLLHGFNVNHKTAGVAAIARTENFD